MPLYSGDYFLSTQVSGSDPNRISQNAGVIVSYRNPTNLFIRLAESV